MKRLMIPRRRMVAMVVLVSFFARAVTPAFAESPVKLKKFLGTIDFKTDAVSSFTLEGTASHLGKYTSYGEVTFVPGEKQGTLIGSGVAVFTAANGDLLVGAVSWDVDAAVGDMSASGIHFSWRDSVTFSDGTTVSSTGHFVNSRPPGLVVIAIIAVLIGLLLPAIQR